LRRQRGADQRAGAGNGGEMVPEQHPLGRRHVIVAVGKPVRRRDAPVIQSQRLGGDEAE